MKKLNALYAEQERVKEQIRAFEFNAALEVDKAGAKRANLRFYQWRMHYEEKTGRTLSDDFRVGFFASGVNEDILESLDAQGVKYQLVNAINAIKGTSERLLVIGDLIIGGLDQ